MADQFFLDLGHVMDREGRKVLASMRTEQWGTESVYVVTFGESATGYWLKVLFDYVLRDGLSDFEIILDDSETVAHFIPAGEIRALVRRLVGRPLKFGTSNVHIRLDVQVFMREPTPALACPF